MDERATRREWVAVLATCGLLSAIQLVGIHRPFLRHHESGGTQYGKHARNHLKFGLAATRGVMFDVSGPDLQPYDRPADYFYPDHPPLPALLLALAFAIFGVHEAVLRGVLILFSTLAVLLFWRVARRRLPWPWSGAAVVSFGLNPMFVYFSIVTVHQVNTLCGILGALLFYLRWRESGRWKDYTGIIVSIVFASLCDWPGYYAALVLGITHLFSTREKRGPIVALISLNFLLFGAYLLLLASTGGDAIRTLLGMGAYRSVLGMPPLHRYLAGEVREILLYFTIPLVLPALLGMWIRRKDPLFWGLLALAADEIAFAQICSEHDYYTYYLAPLFALAAAEGLRRMNVRTAIPGWIAAILFLGQSSWVLSNRLTHEGGYEFYYRLAGAINGVTRPEDKLVILTEDIRFYTPFYADRFSVWYDRKNGELLTENTGGRRKPFGNADLRRLLEANREGFRFAVTADRDGIRRHVRVLATADDATLRSFGVHDDDLEFLRRLCGEAVERDGFLFWRIPGGADHQH